VKETEPTPREVNTFDAEHQTSFMNDLSEICAAHAKPGQAKGVFSQFTTDWIVGGLSYALTQTIQYVGFGYESTRVFKELGGKISEILRAFEQSESGS